MTQQQVRIIGGAWRGRKLQFPKRADLRPTADRVRETLFNWLAPYIHGALCLDLFAGSGALGFEALSRGARHVVMVDQSKHVIEQLRKNAELLEVSITHEPFSDVDLKMSMSFHRVHFSSHIILPNLHYNIVFLDPPFHKGLLNDSVQWLQQQDFLANNALIYMENSIGDEVDLPPNWTVLKAKQAGQVKYSLIQHHRTNSLNPGVTQV